MASLHLVFRRLFRKNLRAAVNLPAGMRVSETKQVVLDIGLVRDYLLLCELGGVPEGLRVLRAQAALESPGFDISPSSQTISVSRTDQVRWTWLIRPKSTGKHAVRIVTAGRDGLRIDLARILPPADWADTSADQLIATIEVFTALGLTAGQDAAIRAIGALLGIVGVVLGYPIWALTRGKPRDVQSDAGGATLNGIWPTSKSQNALIQKVLGLSRTQWKLVLAVEQMEGQGLHHVARACDNDIRPSEAYHRIRSLELDELVIVHKGDVYISRALKSALDHRKLTDLRPPNQPMQPTGSAGG